jgi:RHS repeat-associated protein
VSPLHQSWSFTYNAENQIDTKGSTNSLFDYNGAYAVNRAYTNNGLNQMTTSGPNTLTYTDGRGNLTSDGVNTYGYNELNQLTSRSGGVSLTYDALGRLASTYSPGTSTTQFAYSGDQLVTEYDGSGNLLRRYAPGALGADDPIVWYEGSNTSSRRWLIDDYQGSVIAATDGTGAIIGGTPNTYDEYGVPGSANQGRFQYTGQIYIPELGLYHYKARTYSPTLGRFLEADPIGYIDDLDWYAYVKDDPINGIDPSGLRYYDDGLLTCNLSGPFSQRLDGSDAFPGMGGIGDCSRDVNGSPGTSSEAYKPAQINWHLPQGNEPNGLPPCPGGPYANASYGFGGTIAAGNGWSFNVSVTASTPSNLAYSQFAFSFQIASLHGSGAFFGAGSQISAGVSNGPLTSGQSTSSYREMDAGWGDAVGASSQSSPSGIAFGGGGRIGGGFGAYSGRGTATTYTAALAPLYCHASK